MRNYFEFVLFIITISILGYIALIPQAVFNLYVKNEILNFAFFVFISLPLCVYLSEKLMKKIF